MITRNNNRAKESFENMRGGEGTIVMEALFDKKIPHLRFLKIIELVPGSSVGAHAHKDEAEVYFVLDGEVSVLDNGEHVKLYKGDAHLCSDGEEHSLKNESSQNASVLAIIPTVAQ